MLRENRWSSSAQRENAVFVLCEEAATTFFAILWRRQSRPALSECDVHVVVLPRSSPVVRAERLATDTGCRLPVWFSLRNRWEEGGVRMFGDGHGKGKMAETPMPCERRGRTELVYYRVEKMMHEFTEIKTRHNYQMSRFLIGQTIWVVAERAYHIRPSIAARLLLRSS